MAAKTKTKSISTIISKSSLDNEEREKYERFMRDAPIKHKKAIAAINEFGDCFDTRLYRWDYDYASGLIVKLHHAIDNAVRTRGTKGIRLN